MQFRDLHRQYEALQTAIDKELLEVAGSGHYIMGAEVTELEQRLAEYVGVRHCLACASGTDALTLALMAWGIGESDAVFVPDFTFFATAETVALMGATPVFVDVDATTFNINADSLENAIRHTISEGRLTPRAVIAVDLFGLPADYAAIRTLTQQYNLLLLEDGAQGFGGSIGTQKACSFGDISTTSFFPSKPLGCYGDGGAVFTDNDEWASLIDSYRMHGKGQNKYDNVRIGLNSRLDTMQAAILLVKLQALDTEIERCNDTAAIYSNRLSNIVSVPTVEAPYRSSWAQYTIRLTDNTQRSHVQQRLRDAGIPSMVYYPKPMHQQTAFQHLPQWADYAQYTSNRLCDTVLSLPMHPYLTKEEADLVCSSIADALSCGTISTN